MHHAGVLQGAGLTAVPERRALGPAVLVWAVGAGLDIAVGCASRQFSPQILDQRAAAWLSIMLVKPAKGCAPCLLLIVL